ncbi:uncharacterized protein LOC116440999 [Corvus moneduloides]|uniref:uncharacterized protein LOC116440999 n=1 Tax=Corvus moneduloides TaxID=1196302 RepID=UPI001363BB37|nr:uncharacterized protein LOC116440999 [Corvus moneduloides]XP_031958351.1 uncharacterized protein LOC116440999 [Corvus moneduloides]XP_031958362.1 uncharacterized protein LOC116440999 [Corvus moneduloides]
MEAEIDRLLWDAFPQVLKALICRNFHFSREDLMHFLTWLLNHFRGNLKWLVPWLFALGKIYLFYQLVRKLLKMLGTVWKNTPCPRPYPCIPVPSALPQEKQGDGFCLTAQGCYRLPATSRSLLFPAQDSAGQATFGEDSSPNLLPVLTFLVFSTSNLLQDGGSMASTTIPAASSIFNFPPPLQLHKMENTMWQPWLWGQPFCNCTAPPPPTPAYVTVPGPLSVPGPSHVSMSMFVLGPNPSPGVPSQLPTLPLPPVSSPLPSVTPPMGPNPRQVPTLPKLGWGGMLESCHLGHTAPGGPGLPEAPHPCQAQSRQFRRGEQ